MEITFAEISRMTLFRGFDEQAIQLLDLFFQFREYEVDTQIVVQGVLQKKFFMLIAGEVDVRRVVEGKETKIAELQAGEFFGEINLFDPGVATATVVALTKVKTLEISNEDFRKFIQRKPEVAADFTFQLGEKIARRFRGASTPDAVERELNSTRAIRLATQLDNNRQTA